MSFPRSFRPATQQKRSIFNIHSSSNTPSVEKISLYNDRNLKKRNDLKGKALDSQKNLLNFNSRKFTSGFEPFELAGYAHISSARHMSPISSMRWFDKKYSQPDLDIIKQNKTSLTNSTHENGIANLSSEEGAYSREFKKIKPLDTLKASSQKNLKNLLPNICKEDPTENDPYSLNSVNQMVLTFKTDQYEIPSYQLLNKKLKKVHKVSMLDHIQRKLTKSVKNNFTNTIPKLDTSLLNTSHTNRMTYLTLDSPRFTSTERSEFNSVTNTPFENKKASSLTRVEKGNNHQILNKTFFSKKGVINLNRKQKISLQNKSPKPSIKNNDLEKLAIIQSSHINGLNKNILKSKELDILTNENNIRSSENFEPEIVSFNFQIKIEPPNPLHEAKIIYNHQKDSSVIKEASVKGMQKTKKRKILNEDKTSNLNISKLISYMDRLKQLKLTLEEIITKNVFSTRPYEKEGSKQLIEYGKIGNFAKVEKILDAYGKYLVYDFDHVYQTALHFASKRGWFAIAQLLIKNGADVNAKDITGRTPLFLAIKYNHIDVVKLLLGSCADPWVTENFSYLKLSKDKPLIYREILDAQKLHIVIRMTTVPLRLSIWNRKNFSTILENYFVQINV